MNINQQNIQNLKDLWTIAGKRNNAVVKNRHFKSVFLPESEWPSRLWFEGELQKQSVMLAVQHLRLTNKSISVSVFDDPASKYILEQHGFTKTSEQYGMNLHLLKEYPDPQELQIKKVENLAGAQLWSRLFKAAFGYLIPADVVYKTAGDAAYVIAFKEQFPIGTALLFASQPQVMGVHSMGVIPNWRRQGLAAIIMQKLLHTSANKGFRYASLQASAAGKGLYEKIGFKSAFLMENYQLKNQ